MRDALLLLLILAVAVGWFSAYGPREAVDGSGLGPGDDRMGESPLVVSGPGTEIVTVTQAGKPQETTGQPRPDAGGPETGAEAPREEHMDNMSDLIWYAVGVMTVLIGEFAGVVVAGAWHRLHKEHKEEKK